MSFLDKFFNVKKKKDLSKKEAKESPYMPTMKLPVDEKFTINFKRNGGKFLYCSSQEEVYEHYGNILTENKWQGTKMLCYNRMLRRKFEDFDIEYTKVSDTLSYCFFATCEYLIADNGSILLSSNQIKGKKLKELPDNFIIHATTSQLIGTIGEGLRGIKHKYKDEIPSNITSIKHFGVSDEENFLTYGSSSKNLYLLLLEDL